MFKDLPGRKDNSLYLLFSMFILKPQFFKSKYRKGFTEMTTYTGLDGAVYRLSSQRLDHGGEGEIYAVTDSLHLAAKKYHPKYITAEREHKIKAMLKAPPSQADLSQFAWPVDILYEDGRFVGYIMPRIRDFRKLNEVYVTDDRQGKAWGYYIEIAKNLSAALHCVHQTGHVCGDLNPDNICVDQSGLITLVDNDSYHIYDPTLNRVFRCGVGRAEYVPKELQGFNFGSAPLPTYTEDTDNFALAVLIFCILMNGAHPFMCALSKAGYSLSEFQPKDNIVRGLFPYLQSAPGVTIPVYAPPIDCLTPQLRDLFKRAFVDGHSDPGARPKAAEWFHALEELRGSLQQCTAESSHFYYSNAHKCPWCTVERRAHNIVAADLNQDTIVTTPRQSPVNNIRAGSSQFVSPSPVYHQRGNDFKKKTMLTSTIMYAFIGALLAMITGMEGAHDASTLLSLVITFMVIGSIFGLVGTAIYNGFFSSNYTSSEYVMSLVAPFLLALLVFSGIGILLLLIAIAAAKN
jgi:DNA-binding helix-hairpin-helix protein with protein kinase domain